MPSRNVALWREKFRRTVSRDRINLRRLKRMGWSVLVVWECRIANAEALRIRLADFLIKRQNR